MNRFEKRVDRLEMNRGINQPEEVRLIVITGGIDKEQVDAEVKRTVEDYTSANPEYSRSDITVISVVSEKTKQLLERVQVGERTGKLSTASSIKESTK